MSDQIQIRILIVDDIPETRDHLTKLLGFESDMLVVGAASSGREAIELATRLAPDVVLMDINMPEMNGVEATRRILNEHPTTVVFLCSTYDAADLPADAPTSGAAAYVHKEHLSPSTIRRLWESRDEGAFLTD